MTTEYTAGAMQSRAASGLPPLTFKQAEYKLPLPSHHQPTPTCRLGMKTLYYANPTVVPRQ